MEFEGKVRFLESPKNIWEYIPYHTKVRGKAKEWTFGLEKRAKVEKNEP